MFGFNELSTPVKAIIALGLVLLLVLIAGLLLRRIAGGKLKLPGQGNRTRQPRLGVVDIFEMDRQRQLVLLRRDNVEHLVMIGGPNDLVIEASIVRATARAQVPAMAEAAEKAAPSAAMRAAVPDIAEPVEEPQPIRRPNIVAATPPAPEPAAAMQRAPAPEAKSSPTIASAAVLGGLATSMATVSATTGLAKASTPEPQPKTPAPAPSPDPVAPAPKPRAEENIAASFEAEMARMSAPQAKSILEPIAPPPAAKASAGELEDMTRQLQEALKRPFSGVKPAAAQPPETQPAPVLTAVGPQVASPVTAAPEKIAASAQPPVPAQQPVTQPAAPVTIAEALELKPLADMDFDLEREMASALAPVPQPEMPPPPAKTSKEAIRTVEPEIAKPQIVAEPEPASKSAPAPAPAKVSVDPPAQKPAAPAPAPEAVASSPDTESAKATAVEPSQLQPKPEKPKASEPKTAEAPASTPAAAPTQPDPFSVDAIEAEFARLLNRNAPPKG